ncbi:MAG: hypothetical protein RR744_09295 [Cellulosilyticaceae bacterium]
MYVFKGKVEEYSKRSNELNESADCSVKALATVLNTTYDKAHFHLKEHCGRKNGQGIYSKDVIPQSLKNTKYVVGEYSRSNKITVKQFCEKHNIGRYYVCVRGHAFAIIDGQVYDHFDKPRRRILWAMRVYID